MTLSTSQKGVLGGMLSALALTLVAFGLAAFAHPIAAESLAARLHLLALCVLAPALTLFVAIARLAQHRFTTPADIDGSALTEGTPRALLLQALLQNTLEQLALAVPTYAAWVLAGPAAWLSLAPTAAVLFLLGRLLFFAGYAGGAPHRAFGFALTFYPTLLLFAGALACTVALLPDLS